MQTKLFKQTGIFCLALATTLSAFGMKNQELDTKLSEDISNLFDITKPEDKQEEPEPSFIFDPFTNNNTSVKIENKEENKTEDEKLFINAPKNEEKTEESDPIVNHELPSKATDSSTELIITGKPWLKKTKDFNKPQPKIQKLCITPTNIEQLNNILTPKAINFIIKGFPNVEDLDISDWSLTFKDVKRLMNGLTQLDHLTLGYSKFDKTTRNAIADLKTDQTRITFILRVSEETRDQSLKRITQSDLITNTTPSKSLKIRVNEAEDRKEGRPVETITRKNIVISPQDLLEMTKKKENTKKKLSQKEKGALKKEKHKQSKKAFKEEKKKEKENATKN
jgi:hypothetical protein